MYTVWKLMFFVSMTDILLVRCYPNTHREKRFDAGISKEEAKEMFQEYYDCLAKSNKEAESGKEHIKAVLAMKAQRVELHCTICIRPSGVPFDNYWQRIQRDGTMNIIRENTKEIEVLKDMTLLINRIDLSDAGQYVCRNGGEIVVTYQVDVLFKEPKKIVAEDDTKSLLPAQKLVDHNLEVYSDWTEWSECDTCGKDGRRQKFGTCMVRKIHISRPITPVDVPRMSLFPDGVPCRSTVLSHKAAHYPGVFGRKSEMIAGSCNVPCPSPPPSIKVTDQYGEVVEIIEAGYQPLHKRPVIPKMVIRKLRYSKIGEYEILTCPTSDVDKVQWQRGERPINVETIRQTTKGRVFVDRLNRLHIKTVRIKDTAAYSCWLWQSHVATIKVVAYEAMNKDTKLVITYGGLFLSVILILTYCTCKVCFGKPKRARN